MIYRISVLEGVDLLPAPRLAFHVEHQHTKEEHKSRIAQRRGVYLSIDIIRRRQCEEEDGENNEEDMEVLLEGWVTSIQQPQSSKERYGMRVEWNQQLVVNCGRYGPINGWKHVMEITVWEMAVYEHESLVERVVVGYGELELPEWQSLDGEKERTKPGKTMVKKSISVSPVASHAVHVGIEAMPHELGGDHAEIVNSLFDAVDNNDRSTLHDLVSNSDYYDVQLEDLFHVRHVNDSDDDSDHKSSSSRSSKMQTIFHIACERGYHQILSFLLETLLTHVTASKEEKKEREEGPGEEGTQLTDILLTCTDANGLTPLKLACVHGHEECVAALLRSSSLAQRLGFRLVIQADSENHILYHPFIHDNVHIFSQIGEVDSLLMERQAYDIGWLTFDSDAQDCVTVFDAVSDRHLILSLEPILLSCLLSRQRIFELLCTHLNTMESTERRSARAAECLCFAAFCGNVQCLRYLSNTGAAINSPLVESAPFSSPLFFSCVNKQQEAFGFLIDKGAIIKLDKQRIDSSTLPQQLLLKCFPFLFIMRLQASKEFIVSAFINTFRFRLSGALMVTLFVLCGALHPALCKIINQQEKIPFDAVSSDLKMQAIHFCARVANLSNFKELLTLYDGWDINVKTEHGRTPLHEAAISGNFEIVDHLVDLGADFTIVDSENWSPLRAALEYARQCSALVLQRKTLEMAKQWKRDKLQPELLKRFKEQREREKDLDLFVSALFGRRKLALSLFKNKTANVDMQLLRGTALHYCCFQLEDGLETIDETMNPKSVAKHQQLVANGLIQLGSKMDVSGENFPDALRMAMDCDRVDMVQLLLQKGASFSSIIFDMIQHQEQHEALAKWLEVIIEGIGLIPDMSQTDENERTLLHLAALHKCVFFFQHVVHQLLAKECILNTGKDSMGQTPLHLLALSDVNTTFDVDQELAEALLHLGSDVRLTDQRGHTAAYYALVNGRYGILEATTSVLGVTALNDKNDHDMTLLQQLLNGKNPLVHVDAYTYLIQHGADTSVKDKEGNTLMTYCLHDETLWQAFLQQDQACMERAFLRNDGSSGDNVLHECFRNNGLISNTHIYDILIRHNLMVPLMCTKNRSGDTPLHMCFRLGGDIGKLGLSVLRRYCTTININSTDHNGNSFLMLAMQHVDDQETIDFLLEQNPDVRLRNDQGLNALDIIVSKLTPEKAIVKSKLIIELLHRGAAVTRSTMDKIPQGILLAQRQVWDIGANLIVRNHERVRELIASNADINIRSFDASERTPLLIAIDLVDNEMVKLLLDNGADTSIVDGDENTPLHIAAQRGAIVICKYLIADRERAIESGVVHASNKRKRTPLDVALSARPDNVHDIIELLMSYGANVSNRDFELRNALHLYCVDNHLEDTTLAEMIIGKDAQSLNQCDKYGMTPFHLAAQSNNPHLVDVLLRHQDLFDMYHRDRNDKCAIDYITSEDVSDIVKSHYIRGWLFKKGEKGLLKLYRKRWFVMDEEYIRYYKMSDESEEKGCINVDDIKHVKRANDASLRFDIFMRNSVGGRVYELQADSKEAFDKWFVSLVRRREQLGRL